MGLLRGESRGRNDVSLRNIGNKCIIHGCKFSLYKYLPKNISNFLHLFDISTSRKSEQERLLTLKHNQTKTHTKMPLVVPGITSNDPASKTEEWTNKLVGKKIGDGKSDSVV